MTSVLHIITRMDVGGSSDDTLMLLTQMPRSEFSSSLISGLTLDPLPDLVAFLSAAGVPCLHEPLLRRQASPYLDICALLRLLRLVRRLRPDIVHTHSSKAGFVGRMAARLAGVPRILHTPHGHVFQGYYGPTATRTFILLERLAARFTERIVVLTDAEANQHLAVGVGRREQFVRIPSGVDLSAARASAANGVAVRHSLGIPDGAPLIGSVARLAPIKGLRHLIAAIPEVAARWPGAHLILAGDGEERDMLAKLARDLGMGPQVHFLGFRRDAAAVTAALDVFVLPSLNEGQGKVLVTALALGVPIVATSVGGVPEIVEDGRQGLLVPPADPRALSRAILRLLDDRSLAHDLGNAGRARAELFSGEVMLKQHCELYRGTFP